MTATVFPAKAERSITAASPQLQRGQTDQRQDRGDDPETDDDGRLGPALLLEVMVQRRHGEDALTGQLEGKDLDDDRDRLQDDQAAEEGEHQFGPGADADRAERSAHRALAGTAP